MKNPNLKISSGIFSSLLGKAMKQSAKRHSFEGHDAALNGLLNFWDIRNQIRIYCNDENAFENPMSLLMLAVDDFSELKLRYGEEAASHAHTFVMKQLTQQRDFLFGTRSNILIGEYIPGRYLILLPGIAGTDGATIADYFRKAIAEESFVSYSRIIGLTASIGMVHKPGHNGDQDLMILQADQACEEAQFAGGNKVVSGRLTEAFLKAS